MCMQAVQFVLSLYIANVTICRQRDSLPTFYILNQLKADLVTGASVSQTKSVDLGVILVNFMKEEFFAILMCTSTNIERLLSS